MIQAETELITLLYLCRFMRPPHEIKRGQRGAKPGVPRKSRSTDEETEELDEVEAMEAVEGEMMDDDNRIPSVDYIPPISPPHAYFPKREMSSDNMHPIDLVRHQRHSNVLNPPDLTDTPYALTKAEPLMSQLSATATKPSLSPMIKSEVSDWVTAKHKTESSPHIHS